MIYLGQETKERISANVLSAYPQESAGFLFGTEDADGNRTVTDVLIINREKNFSLNEDDIQQGEKYGNNHELKLLGIYRSHADNQPIPSPEERLTDNPDFTYLLFSVSDSQVNSLRAWRFNGENELKEELISDKPLA